METKRDVDGVLLVRAKCAVCKQCWIRLGGPAKGKCIYGGPFEGFKREEEQQAPPADPVSPVQG